MSSVGNHRMLSRAQTYADLNSTCVKVQVGSMIIGENWDTTLGCNHGCGYSCKEEGCYRVKLYGENSKEHRLPSDCMAVHSEVAAICEAARCGLYLENAVIFVTRYPCEACARAIIESGIKKVVYGREESISDMTAMMFEKAGVEVEHEKDWHYADDNS